MTLGYKTLALFLILGMSFLIGSYLALNLAVYPAFSEFERENSESAVARVTESLDANLRSLEVFNKEYSYWSQTYAYAIGERPEYADENLDSQYWRSLDIDMMLLLDVNGGTLYSHLGSPIDGGALNLEDELDRPLLPGHPLVTHENESDFEKGYLRMRSGLMQVVSYPILRTNGEGPPAGTLVTGQFLKDERIAEFQSRATASISFFAATAEDAPPQTTTAIQRLLDSGGTRYSEFTEESAHEYRLVRDVLGGAAAVLEVTTPRRITQIGSDTVNTALLLLVAATTFFLVAAWLFMQRLIVAPVKQLTSQMLVIRQTGDLNVEISRARSDEVGALAGEFGRLAQDLGAARQDLEKARDEAVAMSQTKSEFLARMSHEIRTPMNGVLGMTELLQNTQLDNKQQRFAKTIYESAESLLDIINDILDFSRIEAGKLQLELLNVDLHELLDETVESLANQADVKGLELINVAPANLQSTLQLDPGRLRQVLTNLVSNAIKFTEKGEVVLRVTATEVDAASVEVLFEVEDTGIGINPDKQKVIFESFAQEDGSTTRLYGGTGLGLAICKQLVELMGGTLEVASTPGKGSTLSFRIRAQTGEEIAVPTSAQARFVAGNKVLIVDDNATNLEILEHQLSGWRADTESACSAAKALVALESAVASGDPHDLAILDMHMPETDGLDLARAIRSNPDMASMKLIMLSSVATPAPEEVMKDLDIAGQLSKPIGQSKLYESLVRVLGGNSAARTYSSLQITSNKAMSGRILLAEDNPVNQAVAIGMLEALGLTVTVASNGQEALETASAESFEIILMDCQMPAMDGFEATLAIRNHEVASGKSATPIVAVTANALKGDRERCLEVGMNDYLSKPFTAEQLQSVLALYLPSDQSFHVAGYEPDGSEDDPADETTETTSPIDHSVLDELSGLQQPGAPSMLQKVINIYLESSEELRNRLRVAIDTANATLTREAAHALKSSSANVGANGLAELCRSLEMMGREDDLSGAPTIHERLEREYDRVVVALKLEVGPAGT